MIFTKTSTKFSHTSCSYITQPSNVSKRSSHEKKRRRHRELRTAPVPASAWRHRSSQKAWDPFRANLCKIFGLDNIYLVVNVDIFGWICLGCICLEYIECYKLQTGIYLDWVIDSPVTLTFCGQMCLSWSSDPPKLVRVAQSDSGWSSRRCDAMQCNAMHVHSI